MTIATQINVEQRSFSQTIMMIVLSEYPNDPRVRREAEALIHAGIGVEVICLQGKDEAKEEVVKHVRVHRVTPDQDKESMTAYLKLTAQFMWSAFKKLQERTKSQHFGLIQIHNMPDYLVFSALPQKLKGTPIVLDLHDLMPELFKAKWTKSQARVLMPFVKFTEAICCAFSNELITTSTGFTQNLKARGRNSDKITMVLNTADERIFYEPEDPSFEPLDDELSLIYHGTIAERFGIHTVIEALAIVKKSIPNVKFELMGKYDPSYREQLETLVQNLELEDNVNLDGYYPLEIIRHKILAADFGVVPYLSNDFMNLALSTKSFEYVALKRPVIASRLKPIESHFSEDAVAYYEAGNAADLAARIVDLAAKPAQRQHMALTAFEQYQSISWEKMEERYVELIRKTLKPA